MTELATKPDTQLAPADQWTTEALISYIRGQKSSLDDTVAKLSEMMRTTAARAWYIGMALAILKDRAGHSEWGVWLEANLPEIKLHTAQRYIRIYTHWSNATDVSHLSLSKALRMVQRAATPEHDSAAEPAGPRVPRIPSTALKTRPATDGPIDPADDAAVSDSIRAICVRLRLDDIGELIARRIMAGQGDSEIAKELTQRAREVQAIHERIKTAAEELGLAE